MKIVITLEDQPGGTTAVSATGELQLYDGTGAQHLASIFMRLATAGKDVQEWLLDRLEENSL